jgi:hypothetical protein
MTKRFWDDNTLGHGFLWFSLATKGGDDIVLYVVATANLPGEGP